MKSFITVPVAVGDETRTTMIKMDDISAIQCGTRNSAKVLLNNGTWLCTEVNFKALCEIWEGNTE